MIFIIFMEFVAFPTKNNAIFANEMKKNTDIVETHVSGSLGLYYSGKCHKTYPNQTLFSDEKQDWCSKVAKSDNDKPFITYKIKNKKMKLTGINVRNGCCYYACCCDETGKYIDGSCCCALYSFTVEGSNDNKTWKFIHKEEKLSKFYGCMSKQFEFQETEPFEYVRIVQDEPWPGCLFCMQINQVEFYGTTVV